MDELIELEIKLNTGRSIPIEDPLERFKAVPLHARFLYTSQDQAVATYIIEHWGAIDSLSKDICDIYQSVAQFNSAEDASDYIDYITHSRLFKKAHLPVYTQLPGIFFYDHNEDAEFISFGPHADATEITRILRRIFEKLYSKPDIAAVRQAKKLVYQTRKS